MITEESSAAMIAHAANMTIQRQREAAKKKQPQAPHRPSSAKKATLPPLSNIAKAGMLRELRYCAAFKYFEELYIKKGMKKETQEEFMYANYHGDNMCRGSLHELTKGENVFSALYDEVVSDQGISFVLKPIVSPNEYYVRGVHFTDEVLACSAFTKPDSVKVTGRTIKDCAEKVALANCKKAMSLVPKLGGKLIVLGPSGGIEEYVSGHNEGDFLKHIIDGCGCF